jgi:hypothetical protein
MELEAIKAAMRDAEAAASGMGEHGIDLQARMLHAVLSLLPAQAGPKGDPGEKGDKGDPGLNGGGANVKTQIVDTAPDPTKPEVKP